MPYPRGVEGNSCETALNPNAQPFEPSGGEENPEVQFEYVQADGENPDEVVEFSSENGETHLPENTLETENPLENMVNSPVKELDSEAAEVNNVESEELISPRTEPVEGKRDGMRKEDNDLLTGDNVERNEHTPLHQVPELRRSTRIREQPDRLTYKSLGSPLVLVMQSLLSGLNQAFTQAFESDELPDVRILTPDRSMIL